jgi:hypothetical protein
MQNGCCQNGFCDWQSRGMSRLKIQAGHEVRAVRRPLPEPKDLTKSNFRKQSKATQRFFFVVVCATAGESFPVASWQGQVRVLLTDLRYLASISTVNSMLCCSEILHTCTCIKLLVRAAMHPEADADLSFL